MPVTIDPTDYTESEIDAFIAAAGVPFDDPYAYPSHDNKIVSAEFFLGIIQALALRTAKRSTGSLMHNYLYNGGMGIWQRGGISGAVTLSDDTYQSADRWNSLRSGSGPTVQRQSGVTGFTAPYVLRLTAGNTTTRSGMNQILEYRDTYELRGKAVKLALTAKANRNAGSGNIDLRYAILEWTGTADSPTSDVVNDWTSSTYTGGNFFISTTTNVLAVGQTSFVHGTAAQATLDATVGSSANNLIVIFWTEDLQAHASDYIDISEVGLYRGTYAPPEWKDRKPQQEVALCQRYYCKSANLDTSPTTTSFTGAVTEISAGTAAASVIIYFKFPVQMRTTPHTISVSAPGSGTANNFRSSAGADAAATSSTTVGEFGMGFQNSGVITDGIAYSSHFQADAEL